MIQRKGLLLVMMEPPASFEDEFNDWYDTEHVPQRKAIAGFETAQRFQCLTGWPRYLALYDLASPGIIESDAYLAISGSRSTPWSQQMLERVAGYYRVVAEQIHPGDAITGRNGQSTHLVFVRFTQAAPERERAIIERLCSFFNQQPGLLQLRIFKSLFQQGCDFLGLAEFHAPVGASGLVAELPGGSDLHMDLSNIYVPYRRRSERS